MSIQTKIEEIRQKPDHIRLRYAWGLSIAGTMLVVIIWILSLAAQKTGEVPTILNNDQIESLENIKDEGTQLKDSAMDIKNSLQSAPPQKTELDQNIDDKLNQQADEQSALDDNSTDSSGLDQLPDNSDSVTPTIPDTQNSTDIPSGE